jgi:hypothetical protein
MAERKGRLRFSLTLGRLIANETLRDLKAICWQNKMPIKINELGKTWLDRTYGVEVEGTESQLNQVSKRMKDACNEEDEC